MGSLCNYKVAKTASRSWFALSTIATLDKLAQIPAHFRNAVTIKLYHTQSNQVQNNPTFEYTISLPTLNGQRLGVTYEPATEADAAALADLAANGSTSLPLYLFDVKPVLKLDDIVLATGTLIGMGQPQYYTFTIHYPHTSYTHNVTATAGDEIVFGINGNGITPELIQKRQAQVPENSAAENMHQAGLHFWMQHDWFDDLAAKVYQVHRQRMPSGGIFFSTTVR